MLSSARKVLKSSASFGRKVKELKAVSSYVVEAGKGCLYNTLISDIEGREIYPKNVPAN